MRQLLLAGVGFTALILGVFGDFLFAGAEDLRLVSHSQGDAARYFVYQRIFSYSELGAGNIPLWNPHTFSGGPHVGIFQSAVFYPLNLIHLLMPIQRAIAAEMALHLLLMSLFSFAWLRTKGIGPLSCFLASVVVIFGATVSLRVLAGQLSVLDTFTWWPLLLLSIDRMSERSSLGWLLAGIFATTMMILAGHPPTVLMAGASTVAYCVPILIEKRASPRFVASLACVGIAPIFLSAAQLWTGLETALEGVRSGGMSFRFSTSHSFPPEQLLTLLAPELFGNASKFYDSYFGRVFYWDATTYVGIIALMLAIHGALGGRGKHRNRALVLTALLTVTAMGGYTPLYKIFYYVVPGFSFVRAPSKFLFFASLFVALLVGSGLDRLRSSREGVRTTAITALGLSSILALGAIWAAWSPANSSDAWSPINMLESLVGHGDFVVQGELSDWRTLMVRALSIGAALAALAAVGVFFAGGRPWAAHLLFVVAVIELLAFARINRGETRLTVDLDLRPKVVEAYRLAGPTRVIESATPSNIAVWQRNHAIWGYDPVILGRYVEFMAFTQGIDPGRLKYPTLLQPQRFHPLLAMLRGRYQVLWKTHELIDHGQPLPRFFLVRDYEVISDRQAVLEAMAAPDFDPRRTVILESEPSPRPEAGLARAARPRLQPIRQSSDHVELEVDLEAPAILVITDSYSRGWRAIAREGSVQTHYEVMPGNYVLRAIPLEAGRHRLLVEYSPAAYRAGAISSLVSGGLFLLALGVWTQRARSRRAAVLLAKRP